MRNAPIVADGDVADVVIVGAGYSGLAAAWSLAGSGRSVIVLEARDRVGGRAWTQKFAGGGFVDNGGQWIGPGMTRILALAETTGVKTFPTFGEGNTLVSYQGNRTEIGAIWSEGFALPVPDADVHEFMSAVETLDRLASEVPTEAPWEAPRAAEWDNQTMASWMDANLKTAGARFALRIVAGGYFSVEPSDLSLLHLLFYIAAAGGVEGLEASSLTWRFDGGAQEIPNRLAGRLGTRKMTLDAFVEHFGEQARSPTHFFQANWANEPWSRGCYCGIPTPGTWVNYRDALRRPVGRLHWAGTETATQWVQYMEGAVRSGERAAAEVQEALSATRSSYGTIKRPERITS